MRPGSVPGPLHLLANPERLAPYGSSIPPCAPAFGGEWPALPSDPGPDNVPDWVLRAMDRAVIDHGGPAFSALVRGLLPDLARVFKTERGRVVVYPTSGTGAWEASLVNVLAPGDAVLAFDYGHFSAGFAAAARNLGFAVDVVPLRWSQSVPASEVADHLRPQHRAVLIVHNETSTGVRTDVRAVREAMIAKHSDALLIVDTVSSLGSMDFRFDEWGVDVALTGARRASCSRPASDSCALRRVRSRSPRTAGARGASSLGVRSLMTTPRVLPVHAGDLRALRAARGARHPVRRGPRPRLRAPPSSRRGRSRGRPGVGAEHPVRGAGRVLGQPHRRRHAGRVFRIGHLGALGDLEVRATLGGVEMALRESGHASRPDPESPPRKSGS